MTYFCKGCQKPIGNFVVSLRNGTKWHTQCYVKHLEESRDQRLTCQLCQLPIDSLKEGLPDWRHGKAFHRYWCGERYEHHLRMEELRRKNGVEDFPADVRWMVGKYER
jgi:hypothetical protein